MLGQAIVVDRDGGRRDDPVDATRVKRACQRALPAWMLPAVVELRSAALPRNPNGKIDRKRLATEFVNPFVGAESPRAAAA